MAKCREGGLLFSTLLWSSAGWSIKPRRRVSGKVEGKVHWAEEEGGERMRDGKRSWFS